MESSAWRRGIPFASKENLETFLSNAEKYAPAYGGWCAYAMLDGDKVEVDPNEL